MQAFWPGPLTLLLPEKPSLPEIVTAGRRKVGVRMPMHPVAQALIDLASGANCSAEREFVWQNEPHAGQVCT